MITYLSTSGPHLYVTSQLDSWILIRVVAIATSDAEANMYMLDNPDTGLVQEIGELRLIAKLDDKGMRTKI